MVALFGRHSLGIPLPEKRIVPVLNELLSCTYNDSRENESEVSAEVASIGGTQSSPPDTRALQRVWARASRGSVWQVWQDRFWGGN